MENELSCGIVRDLLPSYAEKLTGEETNRAVESHLAQCPDCAETLARMRQPEETPPPSPPETVDFLKKVRRRSTRKSLLVGIAMMAVGMVLILGNVFLLGHKAGVDSASYTVSVEDGVVYVSGNLVDSTAGFVRAAFSESAGMVNVELYTAPRTFLSRGSFSARYEAHGQVDAVRSGSRFLWEGGVSIQPLTAKLYDAWNPFVGDMPANGTVADALGVYTQFGEYTNELQTTSQPYGWTLVLEKPIAAAGEQAARSVMMADSCVMLALIDNLDEVTWQYTTDDGTAQRYTLTTADVNAFVGGVDDNAFAQTDVKVMAQTPSGLQTLLTRVHFQWLAVDEAAG